MSFGWILLTSTEATGFCTRPTIVTSLIVMTPPLFCCAEASSARVEHEDDEAESQS